GGGSPVMQRSGRGTSAALAAVALLWAAACARQSAPPGGPPDARPPVVVATTPERMVDDPDFRGPVRFEFDERISEQTSAGSLDEIVAVSPRTGDVRVEQGRRSLTVEVDGGFVPGVVYRVTLLAGVQDMFGNALRDPFELIFSTGADAVPTTVAGEVWDRVTGAPMSGLAVQAVGADSLAHVGVTDSDGIYALRYLPGGAYHLRAFEDVNRDYALDRNEPRGLADFEVAAGDTAFVDVSVLTPDTMAAVLGSAQALDSVTVVLSFDDFLDP